MQHMDMLCSRGKREIEMTTYKRRLMTLGYSCAISALLAMTSVSAEGVTRTYKIEAQPLAKALMAYSKQSDFVVGAEQALVQGKMASPVEGDFSPSDALNRLLAGTGLIALKNADGAFSIVKEADAGTEATGTADSKEGASFVLEEIIVTATKRAESVQDVPISITAVGEEEIEYTGSEDFRDLAGSIPNVTFPQGGFVGSVDIAVRGIFARVQVAQIGFDVGLGVYVDGVYMGKSMSSNIDLADIERVEVLKGPQGTLFGKNTIAGAINIISKKPENDFEADLNADIGNMGYLRARGSVNLPIAEDILSVRVSASRSKRDGYGTNSLLNDDDVGAYDRLSGRFKLAYTPSERTRAELSIDYLDSEEKLYVLENLPGESEAYLFDGERYTVYRDFDETSDLKNLGVALSIEHDFDNGYTLTSITGYHDYDMDYHYDGDSSSIFGDHVVLGVTEKMLSQELRIASPADTWYDYVAGLYYFNQKNGALSEVEVGADWNPVLEGQSYADRGVDVESYAAFIHANFHLNERLTLFGGFRYTDETKKLTTVDQFFIPPLPPLVFFTEGSFSIPLEVKDSDPSWVGGLRYHVADEMMVYGSISTGVKSGAFNSPYTVSLAQVADASPLIVGPEHVTNYEVGFKSSWLDKRLTVNASLFYMDYEDLQVRAFDPTAGVAGTGAEVLSNAAKAKSKGFELELKAYPVEGLSVSAGFGYVDATFDKFEGLVAPRGNVVDASGNRIPLAPKITFNTAIQYEGLMKNNIPWMARIDYNYTSKRYAAEGAANLDEYLLPSYGLLNGRVGIRTSDERFGLYIWGKNLTNEQSPTEARFSGFINPRFAKRYLEPRTFGITLTSQF